MGGGDGDLHVKEAAATGRGDLNLKLQAVRIRGGFKELCVVEGDQGNLETKTKDAGGSLEGGGDTLKRNETPLNLKLQNLKLQAIPTGGGFHELCIVEGDRGNLETKMDEGGSSEGGGDTLKSNEASRPWEEEGGILKLKKEADAAMYHWFRTRSPTRMARKDAQEKAQTALGVAKKRKMKVLKSRYPKELIDHWAACPFAVCEDLSDERLAQRTPHFRQIYAAAKLFEAKNREYWDALIDQQKELGYAEDEIEIETTDNDEEDEEMVKNCSSFILCC